MTSSMRGRLIGAVALLLVFGSGVLAGVAIGRRPRNGVTINIRATTELPKELRDLNLSAAQRDTIGALLLRGRRQVTEVLRELEPRVHAAMDSLDQQIRGVLTAEQRAQLGADRKRRGPTMRTIDTSEVVVDTGGRRGVY